MHHFVLIQEHAHILPLFAILAIVSGKRTWQFDKKTKQQIQVN